MEHRAAACLIFLVLLCGCSPSDNLGPQLATAVEAPAPAPGAARAALSSAAEAAGRCIWPRGCNDANAQLSPVQTDTAFIVDITNSELIICAVNNGSFTVCHATKAAMGGTPPLLAPAGVVVTGKKVIISESTTPARVRVCDWSDLNITSCYLSDFGGKYSRAGGLAVDEAHGRVYVAMTLSSLVLSCRLGESLDDCMELDFGSGKGILMSAPVGLTITEGYLWATAENDLRRCRLVEAGVDGCVSQNIKFVPSGIVVHPAGLRVLLAETEEGRVWVCDRGTGTTLTQNCRSVLGDNTFFNSSAPAGQESNHPGAVSMAISNDLLYVPTFFGEAVSVCRDAAAAADCNWQSALDYSFKGLTSIAVVPITRTHGAEPPAVEVQPIKFGMEE